MSTLGKNNLTERRHTVAHWLHVDGSCFFMIAVYFELLAPPECLQVCTLNSECKSDKMNVSLWSFLFSSFDQIW